MLNLLRRKVYLDNNATTRVSYSVRKTMNRVLKRHWGNPSSGYRSGKVASQIIEQAREQVGRAINAHTHEIYFTGCATESNNAVLQTLSNHFYPEKRKIISSPIEHPSIANTLEFLKTKGIIVEYCSVDKFGFVSAEEIEKLIDNDTFLICCMLANNEIGSIQNIAEISALAQRNNILTLSDCVQAFGKIPIDVKALGVDYATFSAHKLYGPKGVGALYARISSPLAPFIHGGHQEEGMRAGTESVHNIAGFGKACNNVPKLLSHTHRTKQLKELLVDQLRSAVPGIIINSPSENCLPNTISATIPNVSSKELMMLLDYYGISVSSGSACSTHQNKPSRVLKSIGLSDKAAKETLRISLGIHTRKNDITYTLKIIKKYLASGAQ
ncbi:cysteine desulfurase [Carboxylicivirga mesophila]|uniref:cysteine desulfurase n=1 Tax=Carboxylicivirga mesophila TaxID=1166478 RepID=A0ABS5K5M4_9BACT|nr:cysteine desulfurase family protein [Carboxylicivirga mesophila]MBS2209843.1 cysteine desulfurase [Carboxylicivirga mesophila]